MLPRCSPRVSLLHDVGETANATKIRARLLHPCRRRLSQPQRGYCQRPRPTGAGATRTETAALSRHRRHLLHRHGIDCRLAATAAAAIIDSEGDAHVDAGAAAVAANETQPTALNGVVTAAAAAAAAASRSATGSVPLWGRPRRSAKPPPRPRRQQSLRGMAIKPFDDSFHNWFETCSYFSHVHFELRRLGKSHPALGYIDSNSNSNPNPNHLPTPTCVERRAIMDRVIRPLGEPPHPPFRARIRVPSRSLRLGHPQRTAGVRCPTPVSPPPLPVGVPFAARLSPL